MSQRCSLLLLGPLLLRVRLLCVARDTERLEVGQVGLATALCDGKNICEDQGEERSACELGLEISGRCGKRYGYHTAAHGSTGCLRELEAREVRTIRFPEVALLGVG